MLLCFLVCQRWANSLTSRDRDQVIGVRLVPIDKCLEQQELGLCNTRMHTKDEDADHASTFQTAGFRIMLVQPESSCSSEVLEAWIPI